MIVYSPDPRLNIYRDKLELWLDASIQTSYPGSGSSWYDLSGDNRTATLVNSPTYSTTNGGKFNFDAVNDYATGTSLNNWTEQSISIWFKVNPTTAQFIRLIEKGSNNEWCLNFNYGSADYKVNFQPLGTYGSFLKNANSLNDSAWHHCVITISSTYYCKMYLDGAFETQQQSATNPVGKTYNLSIGRFGGGGYLWKGDIAHVAIYDRVLTSAEVSFLYNTTKTRFI